MFVLLTFFCFCVFAVPRSSHNFIALAKAIRQAKEGNENIKDEYITRKPKNKEDLRLLKEVGSGLSRLFANLNQAIEHYHHNYWQSRGIASTVRRPYMTTLERNVLDKALECRNALYERYDSMEGVTKDFPLAITTESLDALFKYCTMPLNKVNSPTKNLSPPFFDTIDIDVKSQSGESIDDEKYWVEKYVRLGTNEERKSNPKLKFPSVKCDV